MKANKYKGNLKEFLKHYNYQPYLTNKLSNLEDISFSQSLVDEIVLWKVNRYVSLSDSILQKIDAISTLSNREHRKSKQILESLLDIRGVDLPMASTFLRFRNPTCFQIIDRHAYRAIYGNNYPLYSSSPIRKKIDIYFEYLDKLIHLCEEKDLEFCTIDRLLYEFDKDINGKLNQ